MLLYMCPHTAVYLASSYCCICSVALISAQREICYICVLILLCMCPHTGILCVVMLLCVSILLYMQCCSYQLRETYSDTHSSSSYLSMLIIALNSLLLEQEYYKYCRYIITAVYLTCLIFPFFSPSRSTPRVQANSRAFFRRLALWMPSSKQVKKLS